MNILRAIGEYLDGLWAIWSFIAIPIVGIIGIEFFPLPFLALIGLVIHYQLQCADIVNRAGIFTGNKAVRKRRRNCYANALILFIVTLACYGGFIYYDLQHADIMCERLPLPGVLPAIIRLVDPVPPCPPPCLGTECP